MGPFDCKVEKIEVTVAGFKVTGGKGNPLLQLVVRCVGRNGLPNYYHDLLEADHDYTFKEHTEDSSPFTVTVRAGDSLTCGNPIYSFELNAVNWKCTFSFDSITCKIYFT